MNMIGNTGETNGKGMKGKVARFEDPWRQRTNILGIPKGLLLAKAIIISRLVLSITTNMMIESGIGAAKLEVTTALPEKPSMKMSQNPGKALWPLLKKSRISKYRVC
jgi:hypothetical protein